MPIKPANKTTKEDVSEILGKFIRGTEYINQTHPKLLGQLLHKYDVGEVHAAILPNMIVERPEVDMRENSLFMFLEPTKDMKILPLVTLYSSDDWREFRLYALLATTDPMSDDNLQTLAIRFETDETRHRKTNSIGAHDFCHAQLCNYISKKVKNVTPIWVPDSQPSIPLDADSQETLVLSMLTSIYGGKHVLSKFYPTDRKLLKHLDRVRALQTRATRDGLY